jgi:hypothetical protein
MRRLAASSKAIHVLHVFILAYSLAEHGGYFQALDAVTYQASFPDFNNGGLGGYLQ